MTKVIFKHRDGNNYDAELNWELSDNTNVQNPFYTVNVTDADWKEFGTHVFIRPDQLVARCACGNEFALCHPEA